MTPEEYHMFITEIQTQEFPNLDQQLEEFLREHNCFYPPNHHFKGVQALLNEEIVADLKEGKRMMSVGCGPALTERLLTAKLGIKPEQIVLADISDRYIPAGFEFHQFDMHRTWPQVGGPFSYIIFPESPLFYNHFASDPKAPWEDRQQNLSDALYTLMVRTLEFLDTPGQIRITSGISKDEVREPVKTLIEAEFQRVQMGYSGRLTYATRN